MTTLTFSLAVFCSEINELIAEEKLHLAYIHNTDHNQKCYYFSHLTSEEDDDGSIKKNSRQDKKNWVKKIDYKNLSEESIMVLLDELNNLYASEDGKKYQKRHLTETILSMTRHGCVLSQEGNLWKFWVGYKNEIEENLVEEEIQFNQMERLNIN